jgi:NADPH2:quinone reductase
MKALVVREKGKIALIEGRPSALDPRKVRVKLEFAGIGFADMMAIRGGYILSPKKPFSPGYEFMGAIESVGDRVKGLSPGERVAGMLPRMGCYQTHIDIDPVWAVPVPPGLSSETAAALPLNYLTAIALIDLKARLRKNDSFLIHGAAGGVGTAALEIARHREIRAFGTVSQGKESDIEALGAVPIIRSDTWLDQAHRLEPAGFQAAFDAFGGKSLRQSYESVVPRGILVSYGFSPTMDGGNGPLLDGLLFHAGKKLTGGGKRTAICGTPSIIRRNPDWYRSTLETIFREALQGSLAPKVCGVFSFNQIDTAHELIQARQVRGKMLLRCE